MGDVFGALRRRWILTIACLIVTMAATLLVAQRSSPTYSYSESMLLLPPEVSRVTDPSTPDYTHGNPLFFLNSLDQTRDILIGSMTSSETADQVAKAYPGVTYTVTPDVLGSGPVLVVMSEATTDATARSARDELAKLLPKRLTELQSQVGVEQSAMITATLISSDTQPTVSHKKQIRSAIMAFGALALLSVFVVGVVDAVLSRTRRRREAAKDEEQGPPQEHAPPPPPTKTKVKAGRPRQERRSGASSGAARGNAEDSGPARDGRTRVTVPPGSGSASD